MNFGNFKIKNELVKQDSLQFEFVFCEMKMMNSNRSDNFKKIVHHSWIFVQFWYQFNQTIWSYIHCGRQFTPSPSQWSNLSFMSLSPFTLFKVIKLAIFKMINFFVWNEAFGVFINRAFDDKMASSYKWKFINRDTVGFAKKVTNCYTKMKEKRRNWTNQRNKRNIKPQHNGHVNGEFIPIFIKWLNIESVWYLWI